MDNSTQAAQAELESTNTANGWRGFRMAERIPILVFIGMAIIGVTLYRDYGMSFDESMMRRMGKLNVEYILRGNRQFYDEFNTNAQFHPVVPEYVYYTAEYLQTKISGAQDARAIFRLRHLITFLLFLAGVIGCYFFAREYLRERWQALAAAVLLFASPRLFADAFYNPKDIPNLTFFMIGMFTLIRFRRTPTWVWAMLHATTCALAIATRISGILIPALTILLAMGDILSAPTKDAPRPSMKRLLGFLGICSLLTVAIWPTLWQGENPASRLWTGIAGLSQFAWRGQVLYGGVFYAAKKLPWFYIPGWISITTPLTLMVSFFFGGGAIARSLWKSLRRSPRFISPTARLDIIVILWLVTAPLAAIILGSTLYSGWRHFFFIYPALILIAVKGLGRGSDFIRAHKSSLTRNLIVCSLVILALLDLGGAACFMIRNHPHQNLYFNAFVRDMKTARQQYPLDLLGTTYLSGLKWILAHDKRPKISIYLSTDILKRTRHLLPPANRERLIFRNTIDNVDYFLGNFRYHPLGYGVDGQEAYSLLVDGEAVMVIYHGEAAKIAALLLQTATPPPTINTKDELKTDGKNDDH